MNVKNLIIGFITLVIVLSLNANAVTAQGPRGGPQAPTTELGTGFSYQGQLISVRSLGFAEQSHWATGRCASYSERQRRKWLVHGDVEQR